MSLARIKNWISGEKLYASDLNAEFNNLINNAASLISPCTASFDLDGNTFIMDAAGATTVVSSTSVSWNFTSGSKSGTPGTTGTVANWGAQTYTDSNTAISGTAAAYAAHGIQRPSLAATNASVTTTDAATFYIANSPLASTNETITNAWALWIDAGNVRFDGNLDIRGGTITTDQTTFNLLNTIATTVNLAGAATTLNVGAATGTITFAGSTIPQNSKSTAYTTVAADANKHVLHPTADNNPRTFTIDSNANVPYPIGTAITIVNQINTVTIAITSDTMTLAGAGTTGSRTLAANGLATALKVSSTGWVISGTGLT